MRNSIRISAILLASAASGLCQTRIDLQAQSRNVDFAAAESTRSFKSGVTLPVNCAVGDTFFKTDAPAGQNFYGCTGLNSWTLQSGGSGFSALSQGLTDLKVTATSGTALSVASGVYGVDGSTFSLSPVSFTIRSYSVQAVGATNPATVTLTASVSGIVRNGDTVQISGVNGSGCGMFNGTFSVVVSGAAQLTLTNVNASGCSYTGGGTVAGTGSGTAYVYGDGSGSVTLEVPASSGVIASCAGSCVVNQAVVPTMAVNGIPLATVTISAGAWSSVTDKRGFLSTRQLSAGTGIAISSSGGGSSLSIDTATVPQLGGSNAYTGANDFSGAAITKPSKIGTSLPTTCSVGESYQKTDATAASQWYLCTSTGTWTAQGGAGHTPNTDTGTNQATWQLDSGNSGPKLATDGSGGWCFKDHSGNNLLCVSTTGALTSYGSGGTQQEMTDSAADPSAPASGKTILYSKSGVLKSIANGGAAKTVMYTDGNTSGTAAALSATLTEARFPALDGDVTTSAGDLTTTIAANAVTPAKMSAVGRTRSFTFVIQGKGSGGLLQNTDDVLTYVWKNTLGQAVTLTAVSCETDSATASRIQLTRRDGSPANILTDNSGAGLDCSSTAASGTLDATEMHFSNGHSMGFTMVSAGGAGKEVAVTVTYTLDAS